ncbi:MAG: PepSY domain-containing protein [Alphaproteobacteria bacterium]
MTKALFNRRIRQFHLWFGLAVGAQIGLWLISGLFMTWFPIDTVRGKHLKAAADLHLITDVSNLMPPRGMLEAMDVPPQTITLKMLENRPVWLLENGGTKALFDGKSESVISPLSREFAVQTATSRYAGAGTIDTAELLVKTPREYGRSGPVWRVNFQAPQAASFYVDATTGEVTAVRTKLWRVYDFMWGLHIMDWSSRENFNSWWIKMTASLTVLFFLSGVGLLMLRLSSMVERRKIARRKRG